MSVPAKPVLTNDMSHGLAGLSCRQVCDALSMCSTVALLEVCIGVCNDVIELSHIAWKYLLAHSYSAH